MRRYIGQLLNDIRNAHRPPLDITNLSDREEDEDMENYFLEVEKFLNYEEEEGPPFHTHCGLQSNIFPPGDVLSDDDLILLIDAFTDLYQSWNICAEIPPETDNQLTYNLLISMLDESIHILHNGTIHWEFCDYDSSSCVFGENCSCLEEEQLYDANRELAQKWAQATINHLQNISDDGSGLITLEMAPEKKLTGKLYDYITGSKSPVPEMAYDIEDYLLEIFDLLAGLFKENKELREVFSCITFWERYRSLHNLLSLDAEEIKEDHFQVSEFHIRHFELLHGPPRMLSHEEMMRELEEYEDLDYDLTDEDGDLPF